MAPAPMCFSDAISHGEKHARTPREALHCQSSCVIDNRECTDPSFLCLCCPQPGGESAVQRFEKFIFLGDDRSVKEVWVDGRQVK